MLFCVNTSLNHARQFQSNRFVYNDRLRPNYQIINSAFMTRQSRGRVFVIGWQADLQAKGARLLASSVFIDYKLLTIRYEQTYKIL